MSDFALEYRTTRERVVHQRQKKATQRQRNMTRGKMIVEVGRRRLVACVLSSKSKVKLGYIIVRSEAISI